MNFQEKRALAAESIFYQVYPDYDLGDFENNDRLVLAIIKTMEEDELDDIMVKEKVLEYVLGKTSDSINKFIGRIGDYSVLLRWVQAVVGWYDVLDGELAYRMLGSDSSNFFVDFLISHEMDYKDFRGALYAARDKGSQIVTAKGGLE